MAITLGTVLHFVFSLLYGLFLSACFAGVSPNRRNCIGLGVLAVLLLSLVGGVSMLWNANAAYRLYPLLVHLPLVLFLAFFCRCAPLIAVASTLSAYFCCQLPRWISKLAGAVLGGNSYIEGASYVLAIALFTWFFLRYAAKPINEMMRSSRWSLITYATVPLIYYLFDYVTTIYTDLLYSGNWLAIQFMPSVICLFYYLFVMAYHQECITQIETQRERDILSGQLLRASVEISTLRHIQQDTAVYRHDMRHHLNLLQEYARQGELAPIQEYLSQVSADLDRITPKRFCSNEPVNLIFAHYASLSEQLSIRLDLNIQLPKTLSIPEPQLCALLSNALENAINALKKLPEDARTLRAKLCLFRGNLLISIENPIDKPVEFINGLPQSDAANHGYGTRSIAAIVNNNKGHLLFSAEDGIFRMQAVIPVTEQPETSA